MASIGIFYGTTTGNTKKAAELIRKAFGEEADAIQNIAHARPGDLVKYDVLILGTSTWGYGDLQDDWGAFDISAIGFTGRKVALFGLGDQESYPDTYVDGMGILHEKIVEGGGTIIGAVPGDGYFCTDSRALADGTFVGLPLDEDNQADRTEERIIL